MFTAVELSEIWNISPRRIAVLCSEGRIVGVEKKGKTWLIPESAEKPLDLRGINSSSSSEPALNIQNRRYLGNKYKLLDFIESIITNHCPGVTSLLDIFAGTGVVSYHFMDKIKVLANDSLYSNYLAYIAFMSNEKVQKKLIREEIALYNNMDGSDLKENYMSKNFSDTYFSHNDCKKIGEIRQRIDNLYKENKINNREFAVLITILIYSMDRVANTCGHYDAYRKRVEYDKPIIFRNIDLSNRAVEKNLFFNEDSNLLVKKEDFPYVDCVYCDPPYNSRNYCDLYHVLENVARWQKPVVVGVARKMDRSNLKSRYCGKDATRVFDDLVQSLKCKYIILSYNSTGDKANDRSNARMSDKDIIRILSKRGKVQIYSQKYKVFSTGKSKNIHNEERLFVCTVAGNTDKNVVECEPIVKSPLNYVGGKTKLLPQLLPLFPEKINTFVDLFCGGANVGVNIKAKKIIYNDNNKPLMGLLKFFNNHTAEYISQELEKIIDQYKLSFTEKYGYEKYDCNSINGLGKYNKSGFTKLRRDFNLLTKENEIYYLTFFALIIFGFNNQIRFNAKGEFNLPVGKRDFNKKNRKNLFDFLPRLQKQNKTILHSDFRKVNLSSLKPGDFVYCDPPYLIGTATYNELGGWSEKEEKDLLDLLDRLHERHIKFALSNVTIHKGKKNEVLLNWSKKYTVHKLKFGYKNSNYHAKNKNKETQEVLITNY